MNYLLFFIYLITFSWLLTKIGFIRRSGLPGKIIIILFLCKVSAGLINGRIAQNTPSMDTWMYHEKGLVEYHLLLNNPVVFFSNLFESGYEKKYDGILQTHNSYWNDLKTNLMVKFVSLLHVASGGNYYINVILFNFLVFFGSIALFRLFKGIYPANTIPIIVAVFILPTVLLFSSSIHKDGLIMAALGLVFFGCNKVFDDNKITIKAVLTIFFSLLVIFLFRSYLIILLVPALTAWGISNFKRYNTIITFVVTYGIFLFLFFNLYLLIPSLNLPALIVQKQADFLGLEIARSYVKTNQLYPKANSFFSNLPQAFAHSFGRPYFTDYKISPLLIFFAIELFLYQFLFLLLFFYRKQSNNIQPFVYCGIFFSFSVLIIIGYTVPVIWAIIRYRSIYLPFILTPLLCNIDWEKIYLKIKSIK